MSASAINFTITQAGIAAAFTADGNGVDISIAHIAFGDGAMTGVEAEQTALTDEFLRLPVKAGKKFADRIEVEVDYQPSEIKNISEIGLFLNDGTLFAITEPIGRPFMQLSPVSRMVLRCVVALANLPAGAINLTTQFDMSVFNRDEFAALIKADAEQVECSAKITQSLQGHMSDTAAHMTGDKVDERIASALARAEVSDFAPAFVGSLSAAGAIIAYAGASGPSGYVKCNGAAVSRTIYADLFAAIGTIYGAGDGSTTFNLPDLRGEFLRGLDDGRGVDAGRTLGSYQTSGNQSHRHFAIASRDYNQDGWVDASTSPQVSRAEHGGGLHNANFEYTLIGSSDEPTFGRTSLVGGAEARPRNIAVHYFIKF